MKTAIKNRVSTRSFEKKALSQEDKKTILSILRDVEQCKGPFGHSVRFFFVDNGTTRQSKIGTYGFIKNPPSFIGGVVSNTMQGMTDFGFLMEQVILRITAINLGTVWLGGTYHRSDFDIEVGPDEIIAAVSPVGYPTSKSLRERLIRKASKGDKRKPFDNLFFQDINLNKIEEDHKYKQYLNAIQIAPSASNKQPWRVVVIDDTFHLYLARTPNYGSVLSFDIQAIDIGIALSHLYLSLHEDGYTPKISNQNPNIESNWIYITSVSIE